jgi:hypothetical protein
MRFFIMIASHNYAVMAGLVPAIHVFPMNQDVDARHKAGHDEVDRCVP